MTTCELKVKTAFISPRFLNDSKVIYIDFHLYLQVYTVETHSYSKSFLSKFLKQNHIEDKVKILTSKVDALTEKDLEGQKVCIWTWNFT